MALLYHSTEDTLEYVVDVSDWLEGGATISSAAWSADPSASISGELTDSTTASALIGNIAGGGITRVTCSVTLSSGEVITKTIPIVGVDE